MDEQDKETINELKRFAIIVLAQKIEEEDLSFEERIRRYLMAWRGEL